jgi:hypothetical protein
MRGSRERSEGRRFVASVVGVLLVCLGASLARQWWRWPRRRMSRSSAETPETAALAAAVGVMADEGAPNVADA